MQTDLLLVPMGATYKQMRAAAVAADAGGFSGLWTWDHLRPDSMTRPTAPPECWTVLAALAEVVPNMLLGPLVLNVANRHPGLVANMAATLQQVSGGRLMLGIGAGGGRGSPYAAEQVAFNRVVPSDRTRAAQVVEAIQVMERLWSGDSSNFAGEHFPLKRPAGFLPAEPAPPIVVGGFGPRMAAIAGQYASGFNTQAAHPRLPELVNIARSEYGRRGGEPGRFSISVFSGIAEKWLRPGSPERHRLEQIGIDRIILLIEPPYDAATIRDAGRMLRSR